jgi:hypothetical protein
MARAARSRSFCGRSGDGRSTVNLLRSQCRCPSSSDGSVNVSMRRSGGNAYGLYASIVPSLSHKGRHSKRCPGRDALSSRFYMFDANANVIFAANLGCGEYCPSSIDKLMMIL